MPTIDIENEPVEDLVAALADGETEIVLTGWRPLPEPPYATVEPYCAVLASSVLQRLVIDTYFQSLTRQASVYCGDLTAAFERCPAIDFAYLIGTAELRALEHPALRDLTVMADPASAQTIASIMRGRKPALTRLALGFSYEHGTSADADAAFIAALADHGLPALTELHLAFPHDSVSLFEGLAASPLFAQLQVLSLEGDFFDDEDRGLAALRAAPIAHLRELYLPIHDVMEVSDDDLAKQFPTLHGTDGLDVFSPSRYGGGP